MKTTYKVTVFLGEIDGDVEDEESFKDAVKESMQAAIELDDAGEDEIQFVVEEIDEDFV